MSAHLSMSKSVLRCTYCGVEKDTHRQLELHIGVCSYNPKLAMSCTICGLQYHAASALTRHIKEAHKDRDSVTTDKALQSIGKVRSGRAEYKCKHCPFTSEAPRTVEAHERRHDGVKSFKCELCPSRFFSREGLTKHLNSHKLGYQCYKCSQKFATKAQLDTHHESHGNDELVCHLCSKVYKTKAMFDRHIRSHDVVHECDQCGKKFPNSSRLRGHVQKVHLRIFHYKCKFCNKGFHEQGGLTRHERMHTGRNPMHAASVTKGSL